MKPKFQILSFLTIALLAPALQAGTIATTFSFQQGDLQQDNVPHGSGASYAGAVDGRILDNIATSALTTTATAVIGNQFEGVVTGTNGRNFIGLYSYDLTELDTFIAANTSPTSSVTVSSVSFKVVASSTSAAGSAFHGGISLFRTDPFTTGATWATSNGSALWTAPYQSGLAETQYKYTGGGSALTTNLAAASPSTNQAIGATLTWTSSATFVAALNHALGQVDNKLYLMAARPLGNADGRVTVHTGTAATIDQRPELLVTLSISTLSDWTGASSTSWATAGNWTSAPGAGDNVRFNSSSTANLATVLNADFNLNGLAVIDPSGPVSIGGANSLTVAGGGIDLSAATQDLTITAPLVASAAQTWNVATGRILSVGGAVTGSGDLTVFGAGKVALGAANILPNGAGTGNLNVSGTLDLNGFSQSINGLTGAGIVDNTAVGAATLTLGNNDAVSTFSGIIQDTGGALAVVKTGTGGLTLTGANDFSGGFTNNGAGNVAPNNNLAFGTGPVATTTGPIYATATTTFANTLTLNNALLRIGGGASRTITWNGAATATGTSGITADGGTGGVTLGSTLNITGATFTSSANGTTNSIVGNISGVGGILNVTLGTLQLSGASNTYDGTTTIGTGCFLRLDATGTLPTSGSVVINGGGLTIRNAAGWTYNGTITGDGLGSVNLNTGTNAILAGPISGVASINANSAVTNTTVSGNITGATTIVSLQGGAILTLSGNNSAMGGTVTVNGATAGTRLNISSANAIGTGTLSIGGGTNGNLNNTSGSALTLSTNNVQAWDSDFGFVGTHDLNLGTGAVTLGGNRAVSVTANTLTVGGAIGGAFGITKTGAGTLALDGISGYTGTTSVNGGTLKLGAAGSITTSSAVSINAGATLDTSAQASYAIPGAQPIAFGIDDTGSGSSGKIAAAGLNVGAAVVTYNITGTPDDPAYVLATYTGTLTGTFASVPVAPAGYTLNYAYQGNKIALVQAAANDYAAWAALQAPPVTEGANGDDDKDGVKNLVEYALADGQERGTLTGSLLSFNKRGAPYGGDLTYEIETSDNLGISDVWSTVVPDANSASIISYTLQNPGDNFARLKVIKTP